MVDLKVGQLVNTNEGSGRIVKLYEGQNKVYDVVNRRDYSSDDGYSIYADKANGKARLFKNGQQLPEIKIDDEVFGFAGVSTLKNFYVVLDNGVRGNAADLELTVSQSGGAKRRRNKLRARKSKSKSKGRKRRSSRSKH